MKNFLLHKNRFSPWKLASISLILLLSLFFMASCAAQRCDCTDLNKRYTPPKHVKRMQRR